mgnify:CR=1 FL=1
MIITSDIINEKDDATFVRKLNESLENNQDYFKELEQVAETCDIEIGSVDPFEDEEKFLLHWFKYRFVIGKNIVSKEQCKETISKIQRKFEQLDVDLNDESTWAKDLNGTSILSKGFLEIYHDDLLAQIRQNRKLYLYNAIIWQTCRLNVSFDRLGLKIKDKDGAGQLPYHVDQHPLIYPDFKTTQGVLALNDCKENGTILVPESHKYFHEYDSIVEELGEGYTANYVQTDFKEGFLERVKQDEIVIPLSQGDYLTWDSRITHTNMRNESTDRYVMYVSAGPEITDIAMKETRWILFGEGEGDNIREAYAHASKKPRFDNEILNEIREEEELTLLGELLYGFKKYESIL